MREEVGLAPEHVPEGGTAAAVDAIGGDDAEMQRGWHVEVDVKLVDLGAILGCVDVELDEAGHGFFAGGFSDAQVGRLAAERTDAAGLEAQAVEPALFGPDLAEPLGRKRGLDPAREEELSQRALDPELVERGLGGLHVAVMHLRRCHADLAGLAGLGGEGAFEYGVRGAVIAIHVRRRKRELGADALEAVPEGVFVQPAWRSRIIAGAE